MTAMGLSNWFGMRRHEEKKRTDEAVSRVIEARATVTHAANRLVRALDLTEDHSRMGVTLERLIEARRDR